MNGYLRQALRTESVISPDVLAPREALLFILQLSVCVSNVVDRIKKGLFQGNLDMHEISDALAKVQDHIDEGYTLSTGTKEPLNLDTRILHSILGLNTEVGELTECFLKSLEGELDRVNFHEELGDMDWYKAIALSATGGSEQEIRDKNLAKLRQRYPDKFSATCSDNRDVGKERQILEGTA